MDHLSPAMRAPDGSAAGVRGLHRSICVICGESTSARVAAESLICTKPLCRTRYDLLHGQRHERPSFLPHALPGLLRCGVCRWPLTPPELRRLGACASAVGGALCDDEGCRAENDRRVAEKAAARDRAVAAARARVEDRRDRQARAEGVARPSDFRVVWLPAFSRRLVNLPERRRRRLRDHLTRVIADAMTDSDPLPPRVPAPESSPESSEVTARACGLCRGSCCQSGGDSAYITPNTIRQYRAEHPEARPRHVLQAFLDRVVSRTIEGSCIYHGARGCTLGELRGDTCRTYYCPSVKGLRERSAEGVVPAAYVATFEALALPIRQMQEALPGPEDEPAESVFLGRGDSEPGD